MARNESRRLKPTIFQADEIGYTALTTMNGYAPANPAYALTAITVTLNQVTTLRRIEADALATAASARESAVAKEWEFHNLMLGVKAQVIAQFGLDSDELKSLGRKKKSEYKPPGRKVGQK